MCVIKKVHTIANKTAIATRHALLHCIKYNTPNIGIVAC